MIDKIRINAVTRQLLTALLNNIRDQRQHENERDAREGLDRGNNAPLAALTLRVNAHV